MKAIGIILILIGVVGVFLGMNMVGDIGVACIVGGLSGFVSGIGFMKVAKRLKDL